MRPRTERGTQPEQHHAGLRRSTPARRARLGQGDRRGGVRRRRRPGRCAARASSRAAASIATRSIAAMTRVHRGPAAARVSRGAGSNRTSTYSAERRAGGRRRAHEPRPPGLVAFRGDPLPREAASADLAPLDARARSTRTCSRTSSAASRTNCARAGYRDAAAPYSREPQARAGCRSSSRVTHGPRYRVGGIEIDGQPAAVAGPDDPAGARASQPGQPFVEARVEADATAIRDAVPAAGFRRGRGAARDDGAGRAPTRRSWSVTLTITEGPRTTIGAVEFDGRVGAARVGRCSRHRRPGRAARSTSAQVERDRDAVLLPVPGARLPAGDVDGPGRSSAPDGSRFDVRFEVSEGPRAVVDHVLVVGNERTKTEHHRAERWRCKPGEPLVVRALAEAQRRRERAGPVPPGAASRRSSAAPGNRRDLLVIVEEAPVNTIGYGGGLEGVAAPEDQRRDRPARGEARPRAARLLRDRPAQPLGEEPVRQLLHARRHPDERPVQHRPGAADRPRWRTPAPASASTACSGTYREPRFLDLPVDVIVTGALDQAIRSTFDFNRRQVNAEASHRFSHGFTRRRPLPVRAHAAVQRAHRSREPARRGPRVPQGQAVDVLRVASCVNTRDDAFEPTRGYPDRLRHDVRAAGNRVGGRASSRRPGRDSSTGRFPRPRGLVLAGGVRRGAGERRPSRSPSTQTGRPIVHQPGTAGQRAVLRRRRHDRARLGARPAGFGRACSTRTASRTAATGC